MDVKTPGHYVLNPRKNITHHVDEMLQAYMRGYRGRGLCEWVFFPAAPRDWGCGRFRRTEAKMQTTLARGQKLKLLGPKYKNKVGECRWEAQEKDHLKK
jgi:hypothetical protein